MSGWVQSVFVSKISPHVTKSTSGRFDYPVLEHKNTIMSMSTFVTEEGNAILMHSYA